MVGGRLRSFGFIGAAHIVVCGYGSGSFGWLLEELSLLRSAAWRIGGDDLTCRWRLYAQTCSLDGRRHQVFILRGFVFRLRPFVFGPGAFDGSPGGFFGRRAFRGQIWVGRLAGIRAFAQCFGRRGRGGLRGGFGRLLQLRRRWGRGQGSLPLGFFLLTAVGLLRLA